MPTPLSIPCPQVIRGCDCVNDPVTNYSSEAPDQPVFFGNYHQPPNAGTYFSPGCVAECTSFVSQEAADECAARQAAECSFDGTPDDGNPVPGGRGGTSTPRFGNTLQTCDAECEGGSGTVTALIPPGTVVTATQADADARAHSLACQQAQETAVCFTTLSPLASTCVNQPMSLLFDATGGTEPYTFALDSGTLPLGTELNAQGNLFGTPTAAATYTFVIRVTDAIGTSSTKEFTLLVTDITPGTLANASVGIAYSQMLMVAGAATPVTWSVIAGTLPDGLALDASSGIIAGTPSLTAATAIVTISATNALLDCVKTFTLAVSSDVPCDLGIDDNTNFGDRAVNTFNATSTASWTTPIGTYNIRYVSGGVEFTNLGVDHWTANPLGTGGGADSNARFVRNGSTVSELPFQVADFASLALLEANFTGENGYGFQPPMNRVTGDFQNITSGISINVRGTLAGFEAVVGVNWRLTRTKKTAIDYAIQVRFVDLPAALPSLTPFDSCTAGAGTVWDGTYPVFEPSFNYVNYEYRITTVGNPFQLNGCALDVPAVNKVYHDTAGQATPTGCAWILAVTYLHPVQGNVVSWVGLGGTGYSPLGTFVFASDVVGWTMFGKKTAVRAATTIALPANTRVVNVLTADAVGVLPAIDGVVLVPTDRVLVKNEALGQNNGVYVVTSVGSGGTPWILTRATDLDTSAEMLRGIFMPVTAGTTLAGTHFRLVTNGPITLNTTALSFTQIAPTIAIESY